MPEKILVVDDDIDSLKLIGLMLQRNGYEVIAANAGNQALARAASDHPDLIILDIMMPDMNGYEVSRRLRRNPDTQNIPIIMFTAKTLIDDKVAGFEAGADDYLTKPTHPAELASRVKAILMRSTTTHPSAPEAKGTAIGVLGAKGGVGTTTLALNIAVARLQAGEKPIIADFRLGMGSMGLSIGFPRSTGMANVLGKPVDDIRPRVIDAELAVHQSGLRSLLSSSRPAESALEYSSEAALTVIRSLRTMGKPAVFDLGSGLSPMTSQLQHEMDQLVLVVDPVLVTLNMARDILQEIDASHSDPNRVHIVVINRSASSTPPSWTEVEHMLGREIRAVISLASELVSQALQANVPAVLFQPTAIASSQMIKLAEDLHNRSRMPAGGEVAS
jgi:CheY-like chemotaxis protein/MinD-like ATPase involved in chromosome partitioning or flagellar assembly